MKLTITGYSTALFSTWFFIDELNLLFDGGDGITSALLHKARKVKNVFISHADRDHVMGLFQFNQLNGRNGWPTIYYPADCGSFPAMEQFAKKFDATVEGTVWKGLTSKEPVYIKQNICVEAISNGHIPAPEGVFKSFSFDVHEWRQKLKPEFQGLEGNEIQAMIKERGKETLFDKKKYPVISYSGDTPIEDFDRWKNSKVLIHEATFLYKDSTEGPEKARNKHSTLEGVLEMVAQSNVEKLILSHFSVRYDAEKIDRTIRELCEKFKIKIPVFRILPGQLHRDILNEPPVFNGA